MGELIMLFDYYFLILTFLLIEQFIILTKKNFKFLMKKIILLCIVSVNILWNLRQLTEFNCDDTVNGWYGK